MLREWFVATGRRAVFVRDPGTTDLGERLRQLVVGPARDCLRMSAWAEALLYTAARAQMVEEVIRPELAAGTIVVSDRFTDSTLAYQGYGLGLPVDQLREINAAATGGLVPDRTIFFDVQAAVGLSRTRAGRGTSAAEDRIEARELAYHQRVYHGYLAIAAAEPDRWRRIAGDLSVEAAHAAVTNELRILFREV